MLPNLIIGGAPKAGTSSLHMWLADHPDAVGSTEKETYYFVDPGTHMHRPDRHIANGLEGYHSYFPVPPGETPRVVLESTPSYLYSETALRHLPDLPGQPRFIFIVREPSAQIYSLFTYFKNNWTWIPHDLAFADYLDQIEHGTPTFGGNELAVNALRFAVYVDYLCRWRDRVGAGRMRVWLFDDLVRDQKGFVQKAAAFAGLDPAFYETYGFPRDNETYEVRSPLLQKLNVALRAALPRGAAYGALRSAYRRLNTRKPAPASLDDKSLLAGLARRFTADNARLAQEFGLDLSAWNKE